MESDDRFISQTFNKIQHILLVVFQDKTMHAGQQKIPNSQIKLVVHVVTSLGMAMTYVHVWAMKVTRLHAREFELLSTITLHFSPCNNPSIIYAMHVQQVNVKLNLAKIYSILLQNLNHFPMFKKIIINRFDKQELLSLMHRFKIRSTLWYHQRRLNIKLHVALVLNRKFTNVDSHLSNGLFFFERCSRITATVCAYKLNNARFENLLLLIIKYALSLRYVTNNGTAS